MIRKTVVITGPDIDRLAEGIHGPEIKVLANQVKQLRGANDALRHRIKDQNKQLRGLRSNASTMQEQLTSGREKREKLIRENALLKARLLNHGITIPEES